MSLKELQYKQECHWEDLMNQRVSILYYNPDFLLAPKHTDYSLNIRPKEHKYCEIRNLNFLRNVKEDARKRRRIIYQNQIHSCKKADVSIETDTITKNETVYLKMKDFHNYS